MTDALFVDVYPGDGPKDWATYIAAGQPWHGAIFKATQGALYRYDAWLRAQREEFFAVAGERFGVDAFEGLYHYLDFAVDGAMQIDAFWRVCEATGGERAGTLWAMLDAERGGQHVELGKTRVEQVIGAAAERYEQLSGRKATLYGGELLRSIGAHGLYGCGRSAVALYAAGLHGPGESTAAFLARTGTDLEHLLLWQYAGDGVANLPGYPREAPGCGPVDISVLTWPGGLDGLRSSLAR